MLTGEDERPSEGRTDEARSGRYWLAFVTALSVACGSEPGGGAAPDGVADDSRTTEATVATGEEEEPSATVGQETEAEAEPMPREPQPQLYLLTYVELRNSLQALIGGAPLEPDEVQPDRFAAGFASAGASEHSLSRLGVERWERALDARLRPLFQNASERAELLGCEPTTLDDPCVEAFFREFGGRVWRRPLTEPEVERHLQVARDVSAEFEADPWAGLRYATQALLQSPYFLHRVYLGESEPGTPGERRLTSYELATKLAFSLTQSTPDAELLQAAASGALQDPSGIEAAVSRLLASPQARDVLTRFCGELFSLAALPSASRDADVIEELPESLLREMEQETLQFCLQGVSGADARTIFQATQTTLGPGLATLYGVEGSQEGDAPSAGPLPDDRRAGILTSAGFLTVMAHEDRTSPTLRGRFVRERLLCQEIPDPPENVVTVLPEPSADQPLTTRERLTEHRSNAACAGCHAMMDPIGFGLEHFDSVGRFRENENGLIIDATGDLDGTPFDGALELTSAIVNHPRLPECLATQWFRFSEARLESREDEELLGTLGGGLEGSGFDFRNLIVELALSEPFRTLITEEVP